MNDKPTIKTYRYIEGFRNPEDWFNDTPTPPAYYKVEPSYQRRFDPMPTLNLVIIAIVVALCLLIGSGLQHKSHNPQPL
jgi:hypothetical protein